jgi:hypothetical protein
MLSTMYMTIVVVSCSILWGFLSSLPLVTRSCGGKGMCKICGHESKRWYRTAMGTYMGRAIHLVKRFDRGLAVSGITVWFASEIRCLRLVDSMSRSDATLAHIQNQPNCGDASVWFYYL